jgi:hypothetical protein
VLSNAYQTSDDRCSARFGSFVALARPRQVAAADFSSYGMVHKLKGPVDVACRMEETIVGGTVSNHFMSFAEKKWGVWPLLTASCDKIKRHDFTFPFALDVEPNMFRFIGIEPASVDTLPDDRAQLGVALDVVFDEAIVVQSYGNAGAPDGAASQSARRLLDGLRRDVRGNVGHLYTVDGLWACLKLASHLKPSSSLQNVLSDAAVVILGESSRDLQLDLSRGKVVLPGIQTLRLARVRLDIFEIMFERQLFMRYKYRRYVMADSSPQLGLNFLVVREDRIRIPRCNDDVVLDVGLRLSRSFESRLCVLSTIGRRSATLAKKSINGANISMIESATDAQFEETTTRASRWTKRSRYREGHGR